MLGLGLNLTKHFFQCGNKKYILDMFAGTATAYALRKLKEYSINCIRVRRSSDNAETDIGFDAYGNLDTSSLLTFVGANNGFISIWYDQSGNNNNANQVTAAYQPRIVNSGVLEVDNSGKPTMYFDGSDDCFNITNSTSLDISTYPFMMNCVLARTNVLFHIFSKTDSSFASNQYGVGCDFSMSPIIEGETRGSVNIGTSKTIYTATIESGIQKSYANGIEGISGTYASTITAGKSNIRIGCIYVGYNYLHFNGILSELVIVTDSVSNRQLLELNQGSYYGITIT